MAHAASWRDALSYHLFATALNPAAVAVCKILAWSRHAPSLFVSACLDGRAVALAR